MSRIAFSITSTLPRSSRTHKMTFTDKEGKEFSKTIVDELNSSLSVAVMGGLKRCAEFAETSSIYKAAVFFQRVVSRTPYDEQYVKRVDYTDPVTHEVHQIKTVHNPDKHSIRYSWCIAFGNNILTAQELNNDFPDMFFVFNSKSDIERIFDKLYRMVGDTTVRNVRTWHIYNTEFDTEEYKDLEYGSYKKDSKYISQGKLSIHHEHGVEGGYSVQAPAGMYRISLMEFMNSITSDPKTVEKYTNAGHSVPVSYSEEKINLIKDRILHGGYFSESDLDKLGI